MAAGANIFASAAGLFGLGCGSVACSFGQRSDDIPQADRLAHLKVLPALFLDEVQQRKSGACNRPTIFGMLLNTKPVTFGNLLILPIVVEVPGTAGIFDTFFCRMAMTHLMQKRTARVFYWAAKCGAADVDFISSLVSRLPDLIAREMPISAHSLFQADDNFGQLPVEKSGVQQAVHFFKLSCNAAGLNGLFHFENLSFKVHF